MVRIGGGEGKEEGAVTIEMFDGQRHDGGRWE